MKLGNRFRLAGLTIFVLVSVGVLPGCASAEVKRYEDPDWHFTLSYPAQVAGHALIARRALIHTPGGGEYLVVLSDLPSPSPDQYDSRENLRVTVLKEQTGGMSLEEWVTSHWSAWGTRLQPMQAKCPSLTSEPVSAGVAERRRQGRWVSSGQEYFAAIATYNPSQQMDQAVQVILASFALAGCQ